LSPRRPDKKTTGAADLSRAPQLPKKDGGDFGGGPLAPSGAVFYFLSLFPKDGLSVRANWPELHHRVGGKTLGRQARGRTWPTRPRPFRSIEGYRVTHVFAGQASLLARLVLAGRPQSNRRPVAPLRPPGPPTVSTGVPSLGVPDFQDRKLTLFFTTSALGSALPRPELKTVARRGDTPFVGGGGLAPSSDGVSPKTLGRFGFANFRAHGRRAGTTAGFRRRGGTGAQRPTTRVRFHEGGL